MHHLYSFLSQLGQETSTETKHKSAHSSVFHLAGLLLIPISATSSTLFPVLQLSGSMAFES